MPTTGHRKQRHGTSAPPPPPRRANQRRRTRKDLLSAAARLLREGRAFDMGDVAAEAMVSRATAYRYFTSIDALLVEAPLDDAAPDPHELFAVSADDDSIDPAARVDRAEAALHEMTYRNEAALRAMLAASLTRAPVAGPAARDRRPGLGVTADGIPLRQNRRTPLIEAALAPARGRFTTPAYRTLCAALALILGTESLIVFKDVLGLDARAARRVKSWAIHALVHTALEDSSSQRFSQQAQDVQRPRRGRT